MNVIRYAIGSRFSDRNIESAARSVEALSQFDRRSCGGIGGAIGSSCEDDL